MIIHTKNTDHQKLLIGCVILLLYCISTFFTDSASVVSAYYNYFFISKFITLALTSSILILTLKRTYKPIYLNKSFLIIAGIYCCLGEVFCPGYHLAFIQVILTTVLIYTTTTLFTASFISIFSIGYFLIFSYLNLNQVEIKNYESYFLDIKIAIFSVAGLSLLLFLQVNKYKKEKEFYSKKYESLGKRFSFLVHDLKGKIQSPSLEVEFFLKNLESLDKADIKETLLELNETFSDIKKNLHELNSHTEEKAHSVQLKEMILTVFKSLNNNTSHSIEYKGPISISGSFRDYESIFGNLIKNSIENFNLKKISGRITITIKDNEILYEDNGGGFPKEILNKINNGIPVSSQKENGNGIGISSVFETVTKNDGNVNFYNNRGRACVKIEM